LITLPTLTGETAVFGLGRSGLACVDALLLAGCDVVAWDDHPKPRELAEKRGAKIRDLVSEFGRPARLIVSPGVPLTYPAPHPIVELARAAATPILGDMDLFQAGLTQWRQQNDAADVPVIGITGTNGKSTTTALVEHMLRVSGWQAQAGGNLGVPILHLDMPSLGEKNAYVLELSSYQLDLNETLNCDIGVLTNITADHLDRHGSMAGYVAAKQKLFADGKTQSLRVLGIDEAESSAMAEALSARTSTQVPPMVLLSTRDGRGDIHIGADQLNLKGQDLMSLEFMPSLRGVHNAQNAAAAVAIGEALGLTMAQIMEAFISFPGLVHRLQPVDHFANLTFVNDSKATNAEASRHALAAYRNVYWIAGGRAKDGGLQGLEDSFSELRHAYLIGEAAPQFEQQLAQFSPRVAASNVGQLERAVFAAADQALADNLQEATILLSPACASFDQFESFEARGNAFCAHVASWKQQHEGGL
jgi:UDP-N-acetylmuramoylalanine--D-glutamate ligase